MFATPRLFPSSTSRQSQLSTHSCIAFLPMRSVVQDCPGLCTDVNDLGIRAVKAARNAWRRRRVGAPRGESGWSLAMSNLSLATEFFQLSLATRLEFSL